MKPAFMKELGEPKTLEDYGQLMVAVENLADAQDAIKLAMQRLRDAHVRVSALVSPEQREAIGQLTHDMIQVKQSLLDFSSSANRALLTASTSFEMVRKTQSPKDPGILGRLSNEFSMESEGNPVYVFLDDSKQGYDAWVNMKPGDKLYIQDPQGKKIYNKILPKKVNEYTLETLGLKAEWFNQGYKAILIPKETGKN